MKRVWRWLREPPSTSRLGLIALWTVVIVLNRAPVPHIPGVVFIALNAVILTAVVLAAGFLAWCWYTNRAHRR